jgi:3-deoxy-D-manno-octulosonate 8-phosphate phosphatase (KDO 8-P phosphatase)
MMEHGDSQRLVKKAKEIKLLLLDVDGVLTDGCLFYGEEGEVLKAFNVRDGFGIKLMPKVGVLVGIISGRYAPLVYARTKDLGIDRNLVFLGSENKLEKVVLLAKQLGLDFSQIAFIGDDWIDLPVLLKVGLSGCVADAHEDVISRVDWVSKYAGGKGAVRELCELIIRAKGRNDLFQTFLSN